MPRIERYLSDAILPSKINLIKKAMKESCPIFLTIPLERPLQNDLPRRNIKRALASSAEVSSEEIPFILKDFFLLIRTCYKVHQDRKEGKAITEQLKSAAAIKSLGPTTNQFNLQ